MAARKKGTLAKAQSRFLKALRDFQKAVSEMTNTSSGATKVRGQKRTKKAKRKSKAKRR